MRQILLSFYTLSDNRSELKLAECSTLDDVQSVTEHERNVCYWKMAQHHLNDSNIHIVPCLVERYFHTENERNSV